MPRPNTKTDSLDIVTSQLSPCFPLIINIKNIFRLSSISEIFRTIVRGIAIDMKDFHTFWNFTNEGQSYHSVYSYIMAFCSQ